MDQIWIICDGLGPGPRLHEVSSKHKITRASLTSELGNLGLLNCIPCLCGLQLGDEELPLLKSLNFFYTLPIQKCLFSSFKPKKNEPFMSVCFGLFKEVIMGSIIDTCHTLQQNVVRDPIHMTAVL